MPTRNRVLPNGQLDRADEDPVVRYGARVGRAAKRRRAIDSSRSRGSRASRRECNYHRSVDSSVFCVLLTKTLSLPPHTPPRPPVLRPSRTVNRGGEGERGSRARGRRVKQSFRSAINRTGRRALSRKRQLSRAAVRSWWRPRTRQINVMTGGSVPVIKSNAREGRATREIRTRARASSR